MTSTDTHPDTAAPTGDPRPGADPRPVAPAGTPGAPATQAPDDLPVPASNEAVAYFDDGMVGLLGIRILEATPDRCEAVMPITPAIQQPFGFVHGGATLTLLETVGSRAAALRVDPATEVAFGIHMDVRHRKSGKAGQVRGVAELDHVEGSRQVWAVAAYDDEGDVMSSGTFETKIVTRAYLAEKQRRREAAREAGADQP